MHSSIHPSIHLSIQNIFNDILIIGNASITVNKTKSRSPSSQLACPWLVSPTPIKGGGSWPTPLPKLVPPPIGLPHPEWPTAPPAQQTLPLIAATDGPHHPIWGRGWAANLLQCLLPPGHIPDQLPHSNEGQSRLAKYPWPLSQAADPQSVSHPNQGEAL